MKIDVYNTHIELYPYTKDDYPIIENMYTSIDKFSQKEVPCGYLINDGKLYLPKGTPIAQLEHITGITANDNFESDESAMMKSHHSSYHDPRNKIQEEAIDFLTTNGNHQLGLNLGTGIGKTFCVAYASTKLREKTLIITPNEGLKSQWIKTYHTMFDYRPSSLMNIAGSNIINAIMEDAVDPAEVYFVNHQTLRSYLSSNNPYMLREFFKKINVGIKVYDEAHMEFSNILLMDFFSNTNRTWYLTATFDRSDKTESVCFKRAFNSLESYGEMETKEVQSKHVLYHVVNINSKISVKAKGRVIGFNGMSSVSYGKYAFGEDENQSAYVAITMVLDMVKHAEGKILIFVPLISAVDEVTEKLQKAYPDKKIGAYHSKVSKDDKEAAEKGDIIVSTIKSCGTGRDIPGLRCVICAEPIASKVVAEQMFGRLRPYAKDKDTFFFDIVDVCIPPINWWFKSRFKKIESLAKKIIYLNLDK